MIIKRSNIGEADRLLTIITDRLGKIKAISKGVRKTKSHLAGSLEPYMLLDLQLHEGKTFFLVTGSSIVNQYQNIHSDIKKTAKAFFIGELIDKFVEENHSAKNIFDLVNITFSAVEAGQNKLLILAFQLKIVEEVGYKPETENCVHCKKKLSEEQNFWDSVEGGIICGNCQERYHHGEKITNNAIKLLRFVENNNYNKIDKLKLPKNIENELDKILSEYIESILEKDIKSRKFLGQV